MPRKTPAANPAGVDAEASNPPLRRSLRERKPINYKERTERDSDVAPAPVPKVSKAKPAAAAKTKSHVISQARLTKGVSSPARGGKKRSAAVLVSSASEGESGSEEEDEMDNREEPPPPPPPPKPKAHPKRRRGAPDTVIEYGSDGEEVRKRDYIEEATNKFLASKDRALEQPLRFVDRRRYGNAEAPKEFFTIAGNSGKDYKVQIRHVPHCTCPAYTFNRGPCKHIIYTYIKVLKVHPDSDLIYQLALTSEELRSIFENAPPAVAISADDTIAVEAEKEAIEVGEAGQSQPNRKPIEGECPICYMDFADGGARERITYCKGTCGNNVHEECIKMWLRTQLATYGKETCPYCRMGWV